MSKLSRREFLKWQTGAALALTGSISIFPGQLWAENVPDIALAEGKPAAATQAAVELLGGMKHFVQPGQRVVLKPNMSFDNPPSMATTTHPEVISTLAAMCREAGADEVLILDHTLRGAEACLENSGIRAACQSVPGSQVRAVDTPEDFVRTDIPKAEHFTQTEVMREVLEADVLIAVPVAKHHGSTGVSLSMKGMMGLIANRSEMHWRYDLHTSIADLCRLLKADLTVIDVTRALTTNGPSGPGEVKTMNTVVASKDMVAADAQVVSMVPWYGQRMPPEKVKHIRIAHEWGLGRMDVDNLNVRRVEV
ncbi:MAG: DUF362 domain-containing protein [Desulfovermiculus sp.]|nr:DUF362 domain-containing protein [Desulfovermiculus sp.]